MKAVATLLVLILASCATGTEPDTATTQDNATVIRLLPQVDTSCQWVAGRACYGQPNDGNNIWPAGMGITRVQVLVRGGPTRADGKQATFLAFVVWNSTAVGRIFRIDLGSDDEADWHVKLDGIVAGRTLNIFDSEAGSQGSTVGSPTPPPHPNVIGPITFDSTYLDVVRRTAGTIDDATNAFLGTQAKGID
ncbi:MAG TPA: hypothetical protein VIX73_29600 [Kofleriaceae bacterium]|jgi:hypothetical protein